MMANKSGSAMAFMLSIKNIDEIDVIHRLCFQAD